MLVYLDPDHGAPAEVGRSEAGLQRLQYDSPR